MNESGIKSLTVVFLCLLVCRATAQNTPAAPCSLEQPAFTTNSANIFNDRQEQDLGDALAELFESDMRISQPTADDRLTQIGERLLATLPPTGVHYRFRVYDSGEVNGFSLAGGRVYISRKLIAAAKNEDELAGVLAHEIGHLAAHQTAITMTRNLRIRLGVTQIGDRADVFAKVHKLFSTAAKPSEERDTEEKDQLVADRAAMYALVRAGYAPESFASFLNETMMNKGKTGNWITDAFGMTNEASQRYRSALKLMATLPAGCKGKQALADEEFLTWKRGVIEERIKDTADGILSEKTVKLDPPLRPSPWRIRFSPDGKSVLVQDEGSITVVDRVAAKVLFQIDAPNAEEAQFTQDSAGVVFNDSQLRVERWNVATGQRAWVKELVVFDGCTQTLLSPDGKTLACVKVKVNTDPPRIGLRLIDVESGNVFLEKPAFLEVNSNEWFFFRLRVALAELGDEDMVTLLESPDGRYFLAAIGINVFAYDLIDRKPVTLGGKLKGLRRSNMTFIGSNELFIVGDPKKEKLRHGLLLSFPDGKVLKDIDIGNVEVEGVTNGEAILVSPLKDYAVGLLSLETGEISLVYKLPALDVWDKFIASEDSLGGVQLDEIGAQYGKQVPLPVGWLPRPRSASFSQDGKFLVVSMRNRSAVWQTETGQQLRLMRPLRSGWFDQQDRLWGQYPKINDRDPVETLLPLANETSENAKDLGKYDDDGWQFRELQFKLKPMGKDKATNYHVTLEVKKIENQTIAWTRDYPHEAPACWAAEDNRLVLGWDLGSETAKDEIKAHPELQKEVDGFKNGKKGILIETVVPETGAPLEQVALPEADLTGGWGDARRAMVSGKFVLVRGEHGNTSIYRLDSGVKTGEFFGAPRATDAASGIVAAVNRENEVLLVDAGTGKELKRFTLGSPVRLARIVAGKERTLMILTADQVVHRVPLGQ